MSWRTSPPVGKIKAFEPLLKLAFFADFRRFRRLARAMLKKVCSRRWSAGQERKTKVQETEMFNSRFAQVATATVGALILSTLSITAAIGPVAAADLERTQTAMVHNAGTQANG